MPIKIIQVSEYECVHCGYKWINRVNGKEGPVPKNCAKCKRKYWNGKSKDEGYDPINPRERGLRRRLCRFEGYDKREGTGWGGSTSYWPNELCKKFLNLNPRPTISELKQALIPLGWNPHRHRNRVPDPDKPNYLKYDPDGQEYKKLLKDEVEKRREFMKRIIEERSQSQSKG